MAKAEVINLFGKVRAQRRSALTEVESDKVISAYGIDAAKNVFVAKKSELEKASARLGFPLAMKVVSPEIVHKTDAGAVAVGIKNIEEANAAFDKIIANARHYNKNARIQGVLLQETLSGTEVIVGSVKDAQFGPTIMFGLGGVFVEAMKDISFRVAPISKNDAVEMINELKGSKILKGARNKKPVSESAIVNVLLKVSQLMQECTQIKELDINPLFVDEKSARAADARIILEK